MDVNNEVESISKTVLSKEEIYDFNTKLNLFNRKVNTEDFITEINNHIAIWDATTEEYTNKSEKLRSWECVMKHFFSDFEAKSVKEKNILVGFAQKKWRNIRVCYNREVQRKKKLKSGSEAKCRKQYTYFDQLKFLDKVYKQNSSSLDENIGGKEFEDEMLEVSNEQNHNSEKNTSRNKKKSTKEDDDLLVGFKKKVPMDSQAPKNDEEDSDRLFLLSLLPDIKSLPRDKKLKVKSDFLAVIASASAQNEVLHPHYQNVPFGLHYPQHLLYSGHAQQYSPLPRSSQLHRPGQSGSPAASTSPSVSDDTPNSDIVQWP